MTKEIKAILGEPQLHSRIDFVRLSRKGISMKILEKILEYTSLTTKELVAILPISERQLMRYEDTHVLKKDISSHLIQLVELFERGYQVFGKEKFSAWIRTEICVFGGTKPLDLLDTAIGIEMVADVIGRIEQGVYS